MRNLIAALFVAALAVTIGAVSSDQIGDAVSGAITWTAHLIPKVGEWIGAHAEKLLDG